MKITTFKNMKGVIHGPDPKRIGCDRAGTLKIGNTSIDISPESDSIMPLLFNGCSGDYNATFTTKAGVVYTLEKVEVRDGRIMPVSPVAVELMELRLRADAAEEKIEELSNIFDTNSLNFLIK
jgi:hypothetical protein